MGAKRCLLRRKAQTTVHRIIVDKPDTKPALIRRSCNRFCILHQLLDTAIIMKTIDSHLSVEVAQQPSRPPPVIVALIRRQAVKKRPAIRQSPHPVDLKKWQMVGKQATGPRPRQLIKRMCGLDVMQGGGIGLAASQCAENFLEEQLAIVGRHAAQPTSNVESENIEARCWNSEIAEPDIDLPSLQPAEQQRLRLIIPENHHDVRTHELGKGAHYGSVKIEVPGGAGVLRAREFPKLLER